MKQNERSKNPITQPLLKDLVEFHKANSKALSPAPSVGSQVLRPAELDQDSGGGYNADGTLPQA